MFWPYLPALIYRDKILFYFYFLIGGETTAVSSVLITFGAVNISTTA